jgi:hypothetical protein
LSRLGRRTFQTKRLWETVESNNALPRPIDKNKPAPPTQPADAVTPVSGWRQRHSTRVLVYTSTQGSLGGISCRRLSRGWTSRSRRATDGFIHLPPEAGCQMTTGTQRLTAYKTQAKRSKQSRILIWNNDDDDRMWLDLTGLKAVQPKIP